jgi:hypothetical protein
MNLTAVLSSLILCCGAISPALAQPSLNLAQANQPQLPKRPPRGMPGNRTERASRSCAASLQSPKVGLVAIAPEWSDTPNRRNVWGQTASEHPTLWFFVPQTPTMEKLEFSLQTQDNEDIHRVSLPVPKQSGIFAVRVPTTKLALAPGQSYQWTLKADLACPAAKANQSSEPNQVFVKGWIERVKSPTTTLVSDQPWYDAVTAIAESRLRSPNDPKLKQAWTDLLKSEQLGDLVDQPLLSLP